MLFLCVKSLCEKCLKLIPNDPIYITTNNKQYKLKVVFMQGTSSDIAGEKVGPGEKII